MLKHIDTERGTLSNPSSQAEISAEIRVLLSDRTLLADMRRAVIRAAGDTGATTDIVQDACIRIMTYAHTFDWTKGGFRSWALRIAANLARNWRKASANNGHESEETDENGEYGAQLVDTLVGSDGRQDMARRSEAALLDLAMERLRGDERIFVEAMLGGKTQTEAGAILGWSPATATRRMRDLVAKVRRTLDTE
jgi:RNA polymerase sigma factor (sigma-70 family)